MFLEYKNTSYNWKLCQEQSASPRCDRTSQFIHEPQNKNRTRLQFIQKTNAQEFKRSFEASVKHGILAMKFIGCANSQTPCNNFCRGGSTWPASSWTTRCDIVQPMRYLPNLRANNWAAFTRRPAKSVNCAWLSRVPQGKSLAFGRPDKHQHSSQPIATVCLKLTDLHESNSASEIDLVWCRLLATRGMNWTLRGCRGSKHVWSLHIFALCEQAAWQLWLLDAMWSWRQDKLKVLSCDCSTRITATLPNKKERVKEWI